jgi:PAS domain S-box-containing protein
LRPDELVQAAFDSLRERICVLDRNGAIVLTNGAWDRFARDNGASPNRCGPGANYLRVCRGAAGPLSERALEAAGGIETVMRGEAPEFTLDYACPSPFRKAWFRLVARPLGRSHTGTVVLHSEITSQVLLAEKLRRTQQHYGELLENPVDVATVLEPDGSVRYQSPASEGVLGIRPEELVGHPIFAFVHPDDAGALSKLLRDCQRYPSRKHPCEYRFRNADGSWRAVESIARKLLSHPEGGIILNSRDVTHRKLAEGTLLAKQDALARNCQALEALAARLFREQEEERRRVAAQLNGSLTQQLAAVKLAVAMRGAPMDSRGDSRGDAPGRPDSIQACVASLGRDLQHLAAALHSATLDHFGLAVALRDCTTDFAQKQGIPIHYVHRGISTRLLGQATAALYRIAEEAMANIAKHAHAHRVWVTLSRTAKGIRLAIRDDGSGFDPKAIEPGSGFGVLAMRERLRAVGGSLVIRARPGAGCEVVALAPLSDPSHFPPATSH